MVYVYSMYQQCISICPSLHFTPRRDRPVSHSQLSSRTLCRCKSAQLTIRRHVRDQGLLYYPNNRYCTGDIHHWVLIVFVVLVIIVRSPASRASWEFLVTVGLAVLCLVYVEVHFIAEDFSHLLQRLACVLKLSVLLSLQMREKIAHP